MELVKITKQKFDERGRPVMRDAFNDFGDPIKPTPVMEDVVCEILHWGKDPVQMNEVWIYYDIIWLKRTDNNLIEYAYPDQVMFLDKPKYEGIGPG